MVSDVPRRVPCLRTPTAPSSENSMKSMRRKEVQGSCPRSDMDEDLDVSGEPRPLLLKDSVNEKSAQKNLGTIRSSNLCTEVVLYSSQDEVAVCNLASLCLLVHPQRCIRL